MLPRERGQRRPFDRRQRDRHEVLAEFFQAQDLGHLELRRAQDLLDDRRAATTHRGRARALGDGSDRLAACFGGRDERLTAHPHAVADHLLGVDDLLGVLEVQRPELAEQGALPGADGAARHEVDHRVAEPRPAAAARDADEAPVVELERAHVVAFAEGEPLGRARATPAGLDRAVAAASGVEVGAVDGGEVGERGGLVELHVARAPQELRGVWGGITETPFTPREPARGRATGRGRPSRGRGHR